MKYINPCCGHKLSHSSNCTGKQPTPSERSEPVTPKVEHTPTPWRVELKRSPLRIEPTDQKFPPIANVLHQDTPEETNANAAFIVRAVNAYEELLQISHYVKDLVRLHKEGKSYPVEFLGKEAEKAIAKAEGK